MGTLTGKTAVVTGSTSGIGLAYARAFAGAGANIVINGMGAPADIERERAAIEGERAGLEKPQSGETMVTYDLTGDDGEIPRA